MRRYSGYFLAFALSAALVLPSLGPLLDHHFIERDPGHLHLGPHQPHVHDFNRQYFHLHTRARSTDAGNRQTALYNRDAGPVAITSVATDNAAMQAFLRFQPTSLFTLPLPSQAWLRSAFTNPPDKPPRLPV